MQWRPAIYAPIKGLSKWKNYTMSTCTIWAYMYAKLGHMHPNCCKAVETHIHTVFSVSIMRFHYRVAVWFMVKFKLTFMLKCSLLWTSWVFRFQIAGNYHQGKQIMPQVQKKTTHVCIQNPAIHLLWNIELHLYCYFHNLIWLLIKRGTEWNGKC